MFQKLQTKWKVSGWRFLLIIITFATGGSLCGYAGRKLLGLTNLDRGFVWVICYIIIITILWPFCVLLISIPLGQFPFFKKYILKIAQRMTGKRNGEPVKIAIFASGAGSNAKKIIEHFAGSKTIKVALIVCNKPAAGVLQIAKEHNIPTLLIEKEQFFRGDIYLPALEQSQINWIILAGFLWKIPLPLIQAYPDRIINIHPALLPKYGGKGMYGQHVHEAVILNKEIESGITVHFVDEIYDHGKIILQAKCTVEENDDAESLAKKIHTLEHQHYPGAIEAVIEDAKS